MRVFRFGLIFGVVLAAGCHHRDRRAVVADKGAHVMPFDLERTTHVFERLSDGGLQQVVSDDGDPEQVERIRAHLSEQASRFARGDFHSPEMIHGSHMPGLHALATGHDRLSITFETIDSGGQIHYRSDDAALISAIHDWFDAQLADHGAHARPHRKP